MGLGLVTAKKLIDGINSRWEEIIEIQKYVHIKEKKLYIYIFPFSNYSDTHLYGEKKNKKHYTKCKIEVKGKWGLWGTKNKNNIFCRECKNAL
jgi:hypothetical protein